MSDEAGSATSATMRWWRGEILAEESAFGAILALELAFFLTLPIVWLHEAPISEPLEWRIFVEAWAIVPFVAFAGVLFVVRRGAGASTLALFAMVNALGLIAVAAALRLGTEGGARAPGSPGLRASIVFAPLALNLFAALELPRRSFRTDAAQAVLPLLLGLGVALLAFPGIPGAGAVLAVGACALILAALPRWKRPPRWAGVTGDLVLVAAAVWLLSDRHLHYDVAHHNWYLGPAHDLLLGGTLLADVIGVYGVLSIQFLTWVLKASPLPVSYLELAGLFSLLNIGQYAVVYMLLRHLGLAGRNAALALGVTFGVHFIGLAGMVNAYPSLGPMRFGLPWLLLCGVALRARRPAWRRASELGESLLVGVASVWSLETFFFSLACFGGILAFECAAPSRRAEGRAHFAKRLGVTVLAVTTAHVALALEVFARAGSWPDWTTYFAMVQAYTPAGAGHAMRPMFATGPWIAAMFACLGSFFACLFALPRAETARDEAALTLVFGATLLAVSQFSVYLGMSSPLRLAAVSIPTVFVAAYWLDRLARGDAASRVAWPRIAAVAGYAAAGLVVLALSGPLADWIAHDTETSLATRTRIARVTHGCSDFPGCLWDPPVSLPKSRQAELLLRKHAADRGALLLLGGTGRATTEVLVRTGRRNAFPLNAPFQDALFPANARRIAASPHRLAAGDVVIAHRNLATSRSAVYELERALFDRVCGEFACREVERLGLFTVVRLKPRLSPTGQREPPAPGPRPRR